jgi:predicted  nucleic acid-binding Zn-ribbon protein
MNLEAYNKLVAEEAEMAKKLSEMESEFYSAQKAVERARKEIRNQVESTYQKGKTGATMKFNGRVLKLRINQRGDSVTVLENGKDIAWFRNGYSAEFAFATGQI